jgi:hypothetical protein
MNDDAVAATHAANAYNFLPFDQTLSARLGPPLAMISQWL